MKLLKPAESYTHTHAGSFFNGLKQIGTICFAFLFSVFSTNLFATDPNIPAGATSASCDNSTLNTYSGTSNLQANWEANKIDLYWYSDDEQITTVQDAATSCNYDSVLSVPSNPPTKVGYTFNGWKIRGVPSGYTKVNGVINSTATHVDTGIADDVDDMEYEIRVKPTTGSWYIFESRSGTIWGIFGSSNGNTIQLQVNCSPSDSCALKSGITRNASHTYYIRASHKNGVATLYVKDETTDTEDTKTKTYASYTPLASRSIGLFGQDSQNTVAGNTIYMARLKKNGVVVRDYVPVKNSSNQPGFWDKVSQSFVGNSNLTAGPVLQ